MNALKALRQANFDYTMRLDDIWKDLPFDVAMVHEDARRSLAQHIDDLRLQNNPGSPLGLIVIGSGGSGKTHLLSAIRKQAVAQNIGFVLADMTDVRDFHETVALGYLNSLQQPLNGGATQYRRILAQIVECLPLGAKSAKVASELTQADALMLKQCIDLILKGLLGLPLLNRQDVMNHQDILRALILMNSANYEISSVGYSYLQGVPRENAHEFGFVKSHAAPNRIIAGLSWIMSLGGASILALDQLDAIVAQSHVAAGSPSVGDSEERNAALAIILGVARGLSDLREMTRRTLIVVSCLETTYEILRDRGLATHLDRYRQPPLRLSPIANSSMAERLVAARMAPACEAAGFAAPYPTWPFRREAFEHSAGKTPREILQLCEQHRFYSVQSGKVDEIASFASAAPAPPPALANDLGQRFEALRKAADIAALLSPGADELLLDKLLETLCRCAKAENPLPDWIDSEVDSDFPGASIQALHVRVRLIHRNANDREEHFCLRWIPHEHYRAFQARLKAASTASGIDRRLSFRHLTIVRAQDIPRGTVTQKMVNEFQTAGGRIYRPGENEIRTLWALRELEFQEIEDNKKPEFEAWLRARRPASELPLALTALPALCARADSAPRVPEAEPAATLDMASMRSAVERRAAQRQEIPQPAAKTASKTDKGASPSARIPLGMRLVGGQQTALLDIPIATLRQHLIVLAGAGSGKTVFLRRLIEEAALVGVPSIVIDSANDLARLGQPWPMRPESWKAEDEAKAARYLQCAEAVIWTPGRQQGNPLAFAPLPDLAAVASDADELNSAVEMAGDALREIVATGHSTAANNKMGVLAAALRWFAQNSSGGLVEFIQLLEGLPPDAGGGISQAEKLAKSMADSLKARIQIDPLFGHAGTPVDPAMLFESANPAKVRLSIVNFFGLTTQEGQRQFLNRLAMTLFAWIKKHPAPQEQPLRGLLVIDEAKDFIPSGKASICKASLMRLAAQARKYGLGLVFATQAPRDIENTVVSNCFTQVFGRMNSPRTIEAVQQLLQQQGISGEDVPQLHRGVFYVSNASVIKPPARIAAPLCLSWHPNSPLTEMEIARLAKASATAFGR